MCTLVGNGDGVAHDHTVAGKRYGAGHAGNYMLSPRLDVVSFIIVRRSGVNIANTKPSTTLAKHTSPRHTSQPTTTIVTITQKHCKIMIAVTLLHSILCLQYFRLNACLN